MDEFEAAFDIMTAEQIAEHARLQREGGFTAESDALTALNLIEVLARKVAAPKAAAQ